MGIHKIIIRIISENISLLRISSPEDYIWRFIITCSYCKSQHKNEINFSILDEVEMTIGHGYANFGLTCKLCEQKLYITFEKKCSPLELKCDGNSEGLFAQFDCRRCEINKWIPDPLEIETESGKIFKCDDILSDWCEYDEKLQKACLLLEPAIISIE